MRHLHTIPVASGRAGRPSCSGPARPRTRRRRVRPGICVHPEPVPAEGDLVHPLAEGDNRPGGWTYACLVWDKSGTGSKGLKEMGGVIDDPYTGELLVVLANVKTVGWFDLVRHFIDYVTRYGPDFLRHAKPAAYPEAVTIRAGQKIANLLVQRVELPETVGPRRLQVTARDADRFGSTGDWMIDAPAPADGTPVVTAE